MARTITNIDSQAASRAVVIAASATLAAQTHAFRPILLKAAAGATITLPAATGSGDKYTIQIGTTITSNTSVIKVAADPGTDIIQGHIIGDADSTDAPDLVITAADTDTLTFDGSTKGGYIGDYLEFIDSESGVWLLKGVAKRTGTEASPFSAAVAAP